MLRVICVWYGVWCDHGHDVLSDMSGAESGVIISCMVNCLFYSFSYSLYHSISFTFPTFPTFLPFPFPPILTNHIASSIPFQIPTLTKVVRRFRPFYRDRRVVYARAKSPAAAPSSIKSSGHVTSSVTSSNNQVNKGHGNKGKGGKAQGQPQPQKEKEKEKDKAT